MTANEGSIDFTTVFQSEQAEINKRRTRLKRPKIEEFYSRSKTGGRPVYDTVGLALSGGGVRSAAFSLGVLQALDKHDILDKADYLSTVSGGGYIGASMTAGMTANGGRFPFESKLDDAETPSVKHIRNYSNYLIPHGIPDVLRGVAIYLRAIVANALLLAPVLFLLAAVTIFINPTVESLFIPDFVSLPIPNIFATEFFVFTRYFLLVLLLLLALWALWRSMPTKIGTGEIASWLNLYFGFALVAVVFSAFCELQPFILAGMFNQSNSIFDAIAGWLRAAAAVLAPFSAIVTFFSKQLADVLKRAGDVAGMGARAAGIATQAGIIIAGIALPFVLWVVYLQLSYWGIWNDAAGRYEAPVWIASSASYLFPESLRPVGWFYFYMGLSLIVFWFLFDPNANSLHRLYRDRLSKAFLFKPNTEHGDADEPVDQDRLKLSELSTQFAPYHLINSAINLQASQYANKRGRNADFFTFSPHFVGSGATGYAMTKDMEAVVRALDVATAVAVSGAAASSNMGSNTIRWLAPTLAMLNVRLGFWLRNPRYVAASMLKGFVANTGQLYFLYEMFGRLNEKRWAVYLTDGGHIENLGIYELLKRRCVLIIAVDAEADPQMNFSSFIKLQRYARIDLGIRIDMPWQEIRKVTLETGKAMRENGGQGVAEPHQGPHCAIGKIHYQDGVDGVLFYIKSSMSGDENDYVLDYKRRHESFPHENTGDQFFSEEQFEAYRALGFHAVQGVITQRDVVAMTAHPERGRIGVAPDKLASYSTLKVRSDKGFGDPVVDGIFKTLKFPSVRAGSSSKG